MRREERVGRALVAQALEHRFPKSISTSCVTCPDRKKCWPAPVFGVRGSPRRTIEYRGAAGFPRDTSWRLTACRLRRSLRKLARSAARTVEHRSTPRYRHHRLPRTTRQRRLLKTRRRSAASLRYLAHERHPSSHGLARRWILKEHGDYRTVSALSSCRARSTSSWTRSALMAIAAAEPAPAAVITWARGLTTLNT